jgi:iron(III) transport system substrate-binding protein
LIGVFRKPSIALVCGLLAAAALALSACGAGGGGRALTLYSGQHEQTTTLLVHAFERQTGIKVQVRFGDEASLGQQVLEEGSSSPADVFYSENSPVLEALRDHGRLTPVAASTLGDVPRAYSASSGDWVAVSARVSALVYNTSQVAPASLPSSILELAGPRFRGKVAFAPSETDFQPLVSAVVKLHGRAAAERWLKALHAGAHLYPDNEAVVNQVNRGQSAVGPINSYYWFRLRDELGRAGVHSALHYYRAGDAGDLVNVSGAAVLASSHHRTAAQAFLRFLVSRAGQEVIARSHSYEYPLRAGVSAARGLPPLASLGAPSLTPAELGDGRAALALEQKLGLL